MEKRTKTHLPKRHVRGIAGSKTTPHPATKKRTVWEIAKEKPGLVQTGFLQPRQPFTDSDFALSLAESGLKTNQILAVRLRGRPSGPRLGLAPVDKLDKAVFFWRQPGEAEIGNPEQNGVADTGAALGQALSRLADETQSTGGFLDLALIVESDAPCLFTIPILEIPYHLSITGFEKDKKKEVIRFEGKRRSSKTIPLHLPENAEILKAELTLDESLEGGHLAQAVAGERPKTGLALTPRQWAGTLIVPETPSFIQGLILAVTAISEDLEIQVVIRKDLAGTPSGRILAQQTIKINATATRAWSVVRFKRPPVLETDPVWLLLKPISGRGFWSAASGETSSAIFSETDGSGRLTPIRRHDQLTGLYQWLMGSDAAGATPSFSLHVNGQTVSGKRTENGRLTFILTRALRLPPSGQPGHPDRIPITFTSTARGQLTLYNPEIHFLPKPQEIAKNK